MLGAVKVWPGTAGAWSEVGATANLDSPCARQRWENVGRGEETGFKSNKETGMKKDETALKFELDFKSPIQGSPPGFDIT